MRESLADRRLGPLRGNRVAFVGDGSSNMVRSFVEAAPLFHFHLEIAAPEGFRPPEAELERAKPWVTVHDRPESACEGAHFVHTDVWTSMGQEAENATRLKAFAGFTVTKELMALAHPEARVMHCLPAHRGEEITDDVLEGAQSLVFTQAENRLHVQKSLLLFLLT
jgi:ornithine carbamoyltransferase